MPLYNADHPGKRIPDDANNQRFQGFFSREDLKALLNQPNCVGIRLYNAGGTARGDRRLIAIGVSADGSEISQGENLLYFRSTEDGAAARRINQDNARGFVTTTFLRAEALSPANKRLINFSAFFSRKMIEVLLADEAAHGVSFFITALNTTILVNGQLAPKARQTHLGVATKLHPERSGAEKFELLVDVPGELPQRRVVSDQPCPGHCVTIADNTAAGVEMAARTASSPTIDLTKYLAIWDDE